MSSLLIVGIAGGETAPSAVVAGLLLASAAMAFRTQSERS